MYLNDKEFISINSNVIARDKFGNFIGIKGNYLLYHDIKENIDRVIYTFECNFFLSLLLKFKIFQRLFRYKLRASVQYNSDTVIFYYLNHLYNFNISLLRIVDKKKIYSSMSSPLYMSIFPKTFMGTKCIIFGEYINNTNNSPIAIYHYCPVTLNLKVLEYLNDVCHIHNIIYSESDNKALIFTGDSNNESNIYSLSKYTKIKKIIGGSQFFRTCIALINDNSLYYCTDNPNDNNFLLNFDFEKNNLSEIDVIKGPVIYGCTFGNTFLFSTNVEPPEIKNNKIYDLFKYYLSINPHDSNSCYCYIYKFTNNNLSVIGKFRKSNYPLALFGFSTIRIQELDNHVVFTFFSTSKFDGYSHIFKKSEV